jgi:hypothetical protein
MSVWTRKGRITLKMLTPENEGVLGVQDMVKDSQAPKFEK